MLQQVHLAAQYLAGAGISFIKKRDDDSHINMGWSTDLHELSTWPLSEKGDQLSLSLKTFSLIWSNPEKRFEFPLDGKSHLEIKTWIKGQAKSNINMIYIYHLHYELPYPFPSDDSTFKLKSKAELSRFSDLFDLSQTSFTAVLKQQKLESELRTWPHHFDLGAYTNPNDSLSIGFGLAVPDKAIDDFYFYVSGYNGDDSVETKDFKSLRLGDWQTEDWKAATLRATGMKEKDATNFLNEAIQAFRI